MSGAALARRIEVDPERIVRWVNGFAERHGAGDGLVGVVARPSSPCSLALSAADGATAMLEPFRLSTVGEGDQRGVPGMSSGLGMSGAIEGLAAWAAPPIRLALVLVRRGGYAVGLSRGSELVGHKVGTRYVQSRTAAGGWSQQRFARRRDNQADALVGSVIEHARRVGLATPSDALVVGGDRSLVRDVLADSRLSHLAKLPRRELFDLPDPRLVVLKQALRRGRAVRITIWEPDLSTAQPD